MPAFGQTSVTCVRTADPAPIDLSDSTRSLATAKPAHGLTRSSTSGAGVSGISRDACQASAEPTTRIMRDALVVLQPDQHTKLAHRELWLRDGDSNPEPCG